MGFEKVEYTFPDEQEDKGIEIEDSSAIEIDISGKPAPEEKPAEEEKEVEVELEIVDDTPKADRAVSYTHLTLPTIYSV